MIGNFMLGTIFGMLLIWIPSLPAIETAKAVGSKIKSNHEITVSVISETQNLYIDFWRMGYLQGGNATIDAINNGESFTKQMKTDSLETQLIILGSKLN